MIKIAIMQPYIFPYLGYFQLISSVNKFIFYDDVNYIKKGWINRNKLLLNNEEKLFTFPVLKASQNKLINEIDIVLDQKWKNKFLTSLEQNYRKAPFFNSTITLIKEIINSNEDKISNLAITSIKKISNHLEIKTVFELSSLCYSETKGLNKADRLIQICKHNQCKTYINPSGGMEIYNKQYFQNKGVELIFIKNQFPLYNQNNNTFIPGLSIIDVLMFNSLDEIKKMLNLYELK